MAPEGLPPAGAAGSEGAGTLDLLTEAIASYLEELDGYRAVCLRHEATTAVCATQAALHLVRSFPRSDEAVAFLCRAAERLPGWQNSPFWDADKASWRQLLANTHKRDSTNNAGQPFLLRGVAWEDRPVLACASCPRDGQFLRLELLLPPIRREWPELPLRTAALGLLCHEYLLPERVAGALPAWSSPEARSLSLRDHLTRTTPQNLCASQCFWPGGAEQ